MSIPARSKPKPRRRKRRASAKKSKHPKVDGLPISHAALPFGAAFIEPCPDQDTRERSGKTDSQWKRDARLIDWAAAGLCDPDDPDFPGSAA